MRLSAALVPHTIPRYVTSVERLNSSSSMSMNSTYTVTMASFTHTSMGPEGLLHRRRRRLDLIGIGHVERQHKGLAPGRLHLTRGGLESLATAGDEPDVGAAGRELARSRTSYASRCSGDDDDLGLLRHALYLPCS